MLTDEKTLYFFNSNGCKLMGFTTGKLEMSCHQSENFESSYPFLSLRKQHMHKRCRL